MTTSSRCPFAAMFQSPAVEAPTNHDWWPGRIDLACLRRHSERSNPMGASFDYAKAFSALDLNEVRADLRALLTDSQPWWPADYGHYGPLFVRMAWHSAGTYRVSDGRGGAGEGMQRFAPLNSWPDNASLDKARRLLWPIKQKYGRALSWADLLILAGNVAIDAMGLATIGFAGGRADVWEADTTYWGPEHAWLGDARYRGDRELEHPLAAVQMGLIYVNPEGPNGTPDPLAAARDIRETFARMAMDDEETVALIAGGHTFGKCHGAAPATHVGPAPEGAPLAEVGLGWKNEFRTGVGADAITSGLEGAWTPNPIAWDHGYFDTLFKYEWQRTTSPAGAHQWIPTDAAAASLVPDAHDASKRHAPIMLTTDLSLRMDPAYAVIARRFHADPTAFSEAFARAWFKLTHRDMGPVTRYVGALVPKDQWIWQDPVPTVDHPLVNADDIETLKQKVLASHASVADLVTTAWASACTFRGTDKRGGANGARLRLAPQRDWPVNHPVRVQRVIALLEAIRADFNASGVRARISLADLIVLAGCAAVERASQAGGVPISVRFTPGRTDATDAMTDRDSFAVLEPTSDGFRNYLASGHTRSAEALLVDQADLLTLTAPELTVLLGGMRALGATHDGSTLGVLTRRPGVLTNDFFVNLLDMSTTWQPSGDSRTFHGVDRGTGAPRWTASRVDLVFASHSELRALAEVHACADARTVFAHDFAVAWARVMELDRFDIR